MRPTFHLRSAAEVTPEFLDAHRIRGVVWDVDGTLMAYHRLEVDEEFRPLMQELAAHPEFRSVVLSNCSEQRYPLLGNVFPDIPVLRGYDMPTGPVFRRRVGARDSHSPEEVEKMLRAGARAIRKPDRRLTRYAMTVLELDDPQALLVVGDQYLTDVATANLAGARSVKVPTFRRDTFPLPLRMSQALESALYVVQHGRPQPDPVAR